MVQTYQEKGYSLADHLQIPGSLEEEVDNGYCRGYTFGIMKTAISIPDPIFEAAEKTARRLGMSRSAFYTKAISTFLQSREDQQITEALNRVHCEESSALSPVLAELQRRSLPEDQW